MFSCIGFVFLPYAGLQNDESLPAAALFRSANALFDTMVGRRHVPLMLMSYLGALKSWLYVPVFAAFAPSYLSIRLPALIIGAVTVYLTFVLLERIHSRTAAWIGTLLLATDSMFLLTTCFDWGPVAIQHFLAVAGLLAAVSFHKTQTSWTIGLCALCFGLGLWDKALFLWFLGGVIAGTLLIYPAELWSHLRRPEAPRQIAIAAGLFLIGCFPLLFYNVNSGYPTLHSASGFTTKDLYAKSMVLRGTWEGAALFGYLTYEDDADHPHGPSSPLESFSFRLRSIAGEHRRNAMEWAGFAALGCLPFLRRSALRAALLFLIATAVAWFQMGVTEGAGGAAHHTVLLWPMPHLIIGLAFSDLGQRWGKMGRAVFTFGTGCLIVMNLLVTNQYLYDFARNGAMGSWTTAINPLADDLKKGNDHYLAIIDWGLTDSLDVLARGRLPLFWSGEPFLAKPGSAAAKPDHRLLEDPHVLWITHTEGNEQLPGVNAGFRAFAEQNRYSVQPIARYRDRNGREIFQTFRLVRSEGATAH